METKFVLEGEMFELKKRMLECFQTQQKTLSLFPANFEKYRPAPHYDFTRPPHLGKLYYENFHWGVNGKSWRKLAQDALKNWRASA